MDSQPLDARRHVVLTGCNNFRDLGGYPTADGSRTRWRRLFRADGLSQLDDGDRAVLASLNIASVIDLRTVGEVEARGRFPEDIEGVRYFHFPLTETLPGEEQAPSWDDPKFVSDRYFGMLTEGGDSVASAIRVLADPDNRPAVFHCSVGKDRTGVLSAVVLGMLGVPDAVIIEDYALSRKAMVHILERLRSEYPDAKELVERYAPVILAVEPAAMAGFVDAVRSEYGSFTALASALGVSSELQQLAADVLEPA